MAAGANGSRRPRALMPLLVSPGACGDNWRGIGGRGKGSRWWHGRATKAGRRVPGADVAVASSRRRDHRDGHERLPPVVTLPAAVPIADPDGVPAPVAFEGEPRSDRQADPKGHEGTRRKRRPIHENESGLIVGHVENLGLGGNDSNYFEVGEDSLLRGVDEGSGGSGLGAQALNRLHHVDGLLGEGLADLLGPLQIFVHPLQNFRIVDE